jgi:hypothetical protein
MKNIDDIIIELKNLGLNKLHPSVPLRDQKILKNISSLITKPLYITEIQGNLLIKILKENLEYFDSTLDIANAIKFPSWSRPFRLYQKIRKVSIEQREKSEFFIKVEFSFDKEIKKAITFLTKKLGANRYLESALYTLTEKNLLIIYENLAPLKFTFSPDFLELYDKVSTIKNSEFEKKFNFENLIKEKSNIAKDITLEQSDLIKLDRRLLYQYTFDHNFDLEFQQKLEYKIANRSQPKIFLNSTKVNLKELVNTIHALNRSKILLIFDDYKPSDCVLNLNLITNLVIQNNMTNQTGIYYRFDNKDDGAIFNKIISENKLNNILNENSKFAGISNGKLPKFFLKTNWYPEVVISFTNNLRSNRTDIYCNDCDLIVYFTPVKPLSIKCDEIL